MFEKETKDLISKVLISAITEAPKALYRAAVIAAGVFRGDPVDVIAEDAVRIADAVHKKVQEAAGTATGGRKAEELIQWTRMKNVGAHKIVLVREKDGVELAIEPGTQLDYQPYIKAWCEGGDWSILHLEGATGFFRDQRIRKKT